MSSRFLAMTVTAVAVVSMFLGCGGSEPEFDPATRYTPASLAQEIAFRCKTLDRSAARTDNIDLVTTKGVAFTKGAATTKAARTNTIDELIAEAIEKASRIPGLSHVQACKKVSEELANISDLAEADKKEITAKLEKVSD